MISVCLLSLVAPSGVAAPPLPPSGGVRIETLTHDAAGPLRAGDRVTVMMRGSAGGSATFHIFGVATNVGMRAVRPGVYQAQPALYTGTYTVEAGDAARNASVLATLSIGGHEVMAAAARPLTIDTRAPAIIARFPKPDATVPNARPNIVARFLDTVSGVSPGAVRLVVNGQDVTARASISDGFAAYNPEVPFAPGPVRVQVTATDGVGNAERAEWSFRIVPSGKLIKAVTINPATPLAPGDILTVVATGEPRGKAWFAIQGLSGVIAMRESKTAGLYFGTLNVTAGLSLIDASLSVFLEVAGRREQAAAATGVTILSVLPPRPTIAAPGRPVVLGQQAETRLVVRGRSQPGFRILGRIASAAKSGTEERVLAEFVALTGADGQWLVALGPVIAVDGNRLSVTAVAIDPAGQRSAATVVEMALEP